MAVAKRDRLRVGFKRLGIAAGGVFIPILWGFLYATADIYIDFSIFIEMGAFAAGLGLLIGLAIWVIPVRIVWVITWVIAGFAQAGSNGKDAPPADEGGEHG